MFIFRIVIEPAGADSSVPCVCSDEPVGDWLKDLQERLYWNVSKTGCALTNNHTSPPDEVCSPNVSSNEDEGHSRLRKTSTLSVSMANIRLPDDAIQGKGCAYFKHEQAINAQMMSRLFKSVRHC